MGHPDRAEGAFKKRCANNKRGRVLVDWQKKIEKRKAHFFLFGGGGIIKDVVIEQLITPYGWFQQERQTFREGKKCYAWQTFGNRMSQEFSKWLVNGL